MSELYRKVGIDETTPVTYVGVYVLKWQPEWGEPSVAFMPAEDDTELNKIMLCGHARRYVVSADEGTNYCMECAYEAEIKENIKLRAQLEQAQEAVESARKGIEFYVIENGCHPGGGWDETEGKEWLSAHPKETK